ncbi:unnamed protein product, partial [marine sediment metagenome]
GLSGGKPPAKGADPVAAARPIDVDVSEPTPNTQGGN